MINVRLEADSSPKPEMIRKLGDGLNQHAMQNVGSRGFNSIAVWAKNNDAELLGGVQAFVNWNWLHICLIWVDETLRRQELGSRLLLSIENMGRERGCTQAHLDTFSFQARGFYERFGYQVYGTLDDYPPGQARYYLRKSLSD